MGAPGLWIFHLCHSGSPASGGSPASEVLGLESLHFQDLVVARWLFEAMAPGVQILDLWLWVGVRCLEKAEVNFGCIG